MKSAQEEVAAVAKKLDGIDPHWYRPERIDLNKLESSSYRTCVIGQAFMGRRGEASKDGEYGPDVARNLGLDEDDSAVLASYTNEWCAEITKRRNGVIDVDVTDKYTQDRIAALKRNGAIEGLRQESSTIRVAVSDALTASYNAHNIQYDWCRAQLARAEAFDAEANKLDAERPDGAAGLAS